MPRSRTSSGADLCKNPAAGRLATLCPCETPNPRILSCGRICPRLSGTNRRRRGGQGLRARCWEILAALAIPIRRVRWIRAFPRSRRSSDKNLVEKLVGAGGFEPPTPCSQSRCATRLRYAPTSIACQWLNNRQSLPAIPDIHSPRIGGKLGAETLRARHCRLRLLCGMPDRTGHDDRGYGASLARPG